MSFSCKIVLAGYPKEDGTRLVYLQAYIDRVRATVSLKFYLDEKFFDHRGQCVKDSHPNANTYNKELSVAIAKGNTIASTFRLENRGLTPALFREEFINPTSELDLVKYLHDTLELKRPTIAENTYRQHVTVYNKLKRFQKFVRFGDVNTELLQRFKNFLVKKGSTDTNSKGLSPATVDKILKILKQYIDEARLQGIKVSDPFKIIRIRNYKSNRIGLSKNELAKFVNYYNSSECLDSHKKLLQYFLFSCHTGVRISDIGVITWNNIHDDVLIFLPTKTKKDNRLTRVPLLDQDKKFLPAYEPGNKPIFKTFSFPTSNEYLKTVASIVGVKKHVTYHTSRHTFASLFAEGGNIQALQQMLGHGSITTTMGYATASTKSLVEAKKRRYEMDEVQVVKPEKS